MSWKTEQREYESFMSELTLLLSELDDLEDYEAKTCSSGYHDWECCDCVLRRGCEICEFNCPFTKQLPRPCYNEKCEELEREENQLERVIK